MNKNVGEMVIMNDFEWPMLLYYVIYDEKFKNVIQRTEKVALRRYHIGAIRGWNALHGQHMVNACEGESIIIQQQ